MSEPTNDTSLLTEVERVLQGRLAEEKTVSRVPTTAHAPQGSARIDQLVLPQSERLPMPFTKEKYLVKDNPHVVAWERVVRQFLRELSPRHEHRVAAVMIYEWSTGISLAKLVEEGGNATSDLRKINKILRHYFGKPYSTHIMGRKVPNTYKVRLGYLIKRHKPMTLTLYAEWTAKTLNP